jgi:hypothetical protein|tara:strand:- start:464 stop:937 length:474 start_codon:yes stop_codon:yes gene_type:complete
MTRKRKPPKPTNDHATSIQGPPARYPCDRCGVPTRSVFEGETFQDEFNSQLDGGLHIQAFGYYGGFWDTLSFMGEGPISFHLCHDCCVWLTTEIPAMAEEATGGHFSSNVQKDGVRHTGSPDEVCCMWGVVDHEQGSDPTGAYDNPKERLHGEPTTP